jgi:hypothetical protein
VGKHTKISILDVPTGFAFGFHNVMAGFGKVLDEHFLVMGVNSLEHWSLE